MKDLISTTGLALLLLAGIAAAAGAQGTAEPPRQEVWLGENLAVSYAARIEGDWLVVDACTSRAGTPTRWTTCSARGR